MKRTYTEIGKEYNDISIRDRLDKAIKAIEWQSIPCKLGMMPAEGIKQCIREYKIPHASHVACSAELAPYGLYGIRGHYKNGMVEVFFVDAGSEIVPVCSDLYDNDEPLFRQWIEGKSEA